MNNLTIIEEHYQKYKKNLSYWLPEDIVNVDINLLQKFDLIYDEEKEEDEEPLDSPLSPSFQIIESYDKMTLINPQFIIWITAEKINGISATLSLIALNAKEAPHLELAFIAAGVYNSSRLVLRLIEKFLIEIEENEKLLSNLKIT